MNPAPLPRYFRGASMPGERNANGPTYPPPPATGLAPVLDRNIEALRQRRLREEHAASWGERLADAITGFTGSMTFVYIHVIMFGLWIVANLNWIPSLPAWDESFVILAMVASVEAIFLSTFVLISQTGSRRNPTKGRTLTCKLVCLSNTKSRWSRGC